MIDDKLETILVQFINEILDQKQSETDIDEPLNRAKQAIDQLYADELRAAVYEKFGPKGIDKLVDT